MNNIKEFVNSVNGKMDIGTVLIYIIGCCYGVSMITYLIMSNMYSMIGTILLYFIFLVIALLNERENINMKARLNLYEHMVEQADVFIQQLAAGRNYAKTKNLN